MGGFIQIEGVRTTNGDRGRTIEGMSGPIQVVKWIIYTSSERICINTRGWSFANLVGRDFGPATTIFTNLVQSDISDSPYLLVLSV